MSTATLRNDAGTLTRAGMEKVIGEGGSVMWDGEVHSTLGTLPDEIELGKHDAKAQAAIAQNIDEQIAKLVREKSRLTPEPVKAQTSAPVTPAADPKKK